MNSCSCIDRSIQMWKFMEQDIKKETPANNWDLYHDILIEAIEVRPVAVG